MLCLHQRDQTPLRNQLRFLVSLLCMNVPFVASRCLHLTIILVNQKTVRKLPSGNPRRNNIGDARVSSGSGGVVVLAIPYTLPVIMSIGTGLIPRILFLFFFFVIQSPIAVSLFALLNNVALYILTPIPLESSVSVSVSMSMSGKQNRKRRRIYRFPSCFRGIVYRQYITIGIVVFL